MHPSNVQYARKLIKFSLGFSCNVNKNNLVREKIKEQVWPFTWHV